MYSFGVDTGSFNGIRQDINERLLRAIVTEQDDGTSTSAKILANVVSRLAAHDGFGSHRERELAEGPQRAAENGDTRYRSRGVAPYARRGIEGVAASGRELLKRARQDLADGTEPDRSGIGGKLER